MNDVEYRHGYFKALLDISNFIENHSDSISTKKLRYKKLETVHSVIKFILRDSKVLDEFMEYGGEKPCFVISETDKKSGGFYVNKV